MRHAPAFAAGLGITLAASLASAAVMQPAPDSTTLPQPVPADEKAVVMSRGFPASALDLATVFTMRNEAINTTSDATTVGIFYPHCPGPVTVEFVLNGGGCSMALAWYNVTASNSPPAAADLFTAVPANARQMMSCSQVDFCPLAAAPMLFTTWTPVPFAANVCDDPRYMGGAIGFALIGNATSVCPATKYSEPRYDVVCTSCTPAEPWVTMLSYHSTVESDQYYLAFEDLPMSPTNWKRVSSTSTIGADGDFNDFVFAVHGMCAGQACPAGGTGGRSGTGGASGSGGASGTGGAPASGGRAGTGGGPSSSGGATGSGGNSVGSGGAAPGGQPGTGGDGSSSTGGAGGLSDVDGGAGMQCVPGRTLSCACPSGTTGVQMCRDDGLSFQPCQCAVPNKPMGCGCAVSPEAEGVGLGMTAFALCVLAAVIAWMRRRPARVRRRCAPWRV